MDEACLCSITIDKQPVNIVLKLCFFLLFEQPVIIT